MALLDRVRERVESDLSDDELLAMIAEATAEIENAWGPNAETRAEYLTGGARTLTLFRPADAAEPITVTENGTALDSSTYALAHGGRTIRRLQSAAWPSGRACWGSEVVVTYTVQDTQAQRDEATIKLVGLAAEYRGGLRADRIGDSSSNYAVWAEERDMLLARLAPWSSFTMA